MVVVFSIIVIILGITLFDYFTARRWQQITSSVRNNLVFEHRNQEYGAFVLRRDYDKRLLIIMASLVLTLGALYGTYMIIKNLPEEVIPPPPVDKSQFLVAAPPLEEDVPPPPKEELPPPMEKTVAFMPPVVVDIPVDDPIPPQDAMDDKKASTENNDTETENWVPPVVGEKEPEVTETKEEIYTYVEEDPEFPGGYAAMMAFIQKNFNYPQVAIENNIQGKCYIKFVVKSDGSVSGVQVERGISGCPECDKEASRVVRMMPGWKPGKVKGKSVSTLYRLPINFALE